MRLWDHIVNGLASLLGPPAPPMLPYIPTRPRPSLLYQIHFDAISYPIYERAQASMLNRYPFKHDGKDWFITRVTIAMDGDLIIEGISYPDFNWNA